MNSDDAVRAAWEAFCANGDDDMQAALEAAAPYLLAGDVQWGVRDRESLLVAGHPTEESAAQCAAEHPDWYEVVKRPRPRFNPPWESVSPSPYRSQA